jgi:hypothetical protein
MTSYTPIVSHRHVEAPVPLKSRAKSFEGSNFAGMRLQREAKRKRRKPAPNQMASFMQDLSFLEEKKQLHVSSLILFAGFIQVILHVL